MKKISLILFLSIITINIFCQNIFPIDTLDKKYIIFYKPRVSTYSYGDRLIRKRNVSKNFFFNIPIGLKVKYGRYSANIVRYVFSNEKETVVIRIYQEKIKKVEYWNKLYDKIKEEVFWYGLYNEQKNEELLKMFERENDIEIKKNMYCGYYFYKKKYIVYYYNVSEQDVELFNASIKSIRRKK